MSLPTPAEIDDMTYFHEGDPFIALHDGAASTKEMTFFYEGDPLILVPASGGGSTARTILLCGVWG